MPGEHSAQSRESASANSQLRTGKTRGRNPRALKPDEVVAFEARWGELKAQIRAAMEKRRDARFRGKAAHQADRAITEGQRGMNENQEGRMKAKCVMDKNQSSILEVNNCCLNRLIDQQDLASSASATGLAASSSSATGKATYTSHESASSQAPKCRPAMQGLCP